MAKEKLHMSVGQNIGAVLLEIAQNAIKQGEPSKAISTYTTTLQGFKEEYVIQLLKNKCVLVTTDDAEDDGCDVRLTSCAAEISNNWRNITNWDWWTADCLFSMTEIVKTLKKIKEDFLVIIGRSVLDYSIVDIVYNTFGRETAKNIGIHNIAAKKIAGTKLTPEERKIWNEYIVYIDYDKAALYQIALSSIVMYVENIRKLHSKYKCFTESYEFLMKNAMCKRVPFVENKLEAVYDMLYEFSDTAYGYYHPLCNVELSAYKDQIDDDIRKIPIGKEYCLLKCVQKNIMDGYDAGWLSPDGKFYGENGEASSMIHLRIAEKLKGCINGDKELEKEGWIKIHGDEVYGAFIGSRKPTANFPYHYCPTKKQIEMVCDYIDKFHKGLLLTRPRCVCSSLPISTYKLRQMDDIKLHEVFQ